MAMGVLGVEARPATGDSPSASGRITFVDNAVDQTTGTIKIKGTFGNENRALWPGQAVNVTVRLTTERTAIVVPSLAVQNGPDGFYVYLVKPDQTVELRPVNVARVAGSETVIKDGVVVGDTVVTDGHLRLVPRSLVVLGRPQQVVDQEPDDGVGLADLPPGLNLGSRGADRLPRAEGRPRGQGEAE